ncbi:hypothetical protein QBC39DRAFT_326585 [Podospora conica]|nr:hypothetical protein QBC39DRAFT_326585 [Schizothecium conicum]
MDPNGKTAAQSPLDSFLSWTPDQTYLGSGPSYPPDALVFADSTSSIYLPQATDLGNYLARSTSTFPGWATPSHLPMTAAMAPTEYLSPDALLSPMVWSAPETDSDSAGLEHDELYPPLDTHFTPGPELDYPSPPTWPWSHSPSPIASPALHKALPESAITQPPKPTSKLRTAARKPRKVAAKHAASSPSDDATLTPDQRRARRNHNIVEKQYRNRLNAQFERLLAVLPSEEHGTPGDGTQDAEEGLETASDRRMSKAEVLEVATRRIKALEVERRRLYRERRELLQNIEALTRREGVVCGE